MTRLRRIAAAALLSVSVLVGQAAGTLDVPIAAAQAVDNSTPDHALPFTGNASGALAGGLGGHFAYYKFQYPGNWAKVTINLTATPNDYAILQYVGFKLYGPSAGREYIDAKAQKDANPSATGDLSNTEPGEYVIQVYSYAPDAGATVNFQLSTTGLPEQPAQARPAPAALPAAPAFAPGPAIAAPAPLPAAPAAAPAVSAAPRGDNSTAEGALQFTGKADGQLSGGQGGHFQYFKFMYPGDWSKVSIGLTATPNDYAVLQYVGFKLYGPNPGHEYIDAKAQKDANPNAIGELSNTEPGEYVIQVYSYAPNTETTVTFQLTATGLAPQPAAAPAAAGPARAPVAAPAPAAAPAAAAAPATPGDISSSDRAFPLTAQRSSQDGALAGGGGGHFHYYKFTYAGDTRTITVNLQASPNDYAILQYVGYKLYGPSVGREYIDAKAQKDSTPSASGTLSNQEPGIYTIQVYSYVPNPDTTVFYTVSVSGL